MITGSAITDKVRGYLSSVVIARLVGGTKVPLDIACAPLSERGTGRGSSMQPAQAVFTFHICTIYANLP